jgi:hypothetical protein
LEIVKRRDIMGTNGLNGIGSSQAKSSGTKVGIEWKIIAGKPCLLFTFEGHLTDDSAEEAVIKWKDEFSKRPGLKVFLVWESLEMTGYDKQARIIWQNTILEYKNRIDGIYIITKSKLISAGAHFIGIATGMKVNGVDSFAELEYRLTGLWDSDVK